MEIKELLALLRSYVEPENDFRGLCRSTRLMFWDKLISEDAYLLLEDYIRDNKPRIFQKHFSYIAWITYSLYYWLPADSKKPRLRWLDSQIKKL